MSCCYITDVREIYVDWWLYPTHQVTPQCAGIQTTACRLGTGAGPATVGTKGTVEQASVAEHEQDRMKAVVCNTNASREDGVQKGASESRRVRRMCATTKLRKS
jgi:hypothetical protein